MLICGTETEYGMLMDAVDKKKQCAQVDQYLTESLIELFSRDVLVDASRWLKNGGLLCFEEQPRLREREKLPRKLHDKEAAFRAVGLRQIFQDRPEMGPPGFSGTVRNRR